MTNTPQPPQVACCNHSPDLVDLMTDVLAYDGFRTAPFTVTHEDGPRPVIDFLHQTRPQACVYAISVPYRESWAVFQQVQQAVPDCAWVLTTTDKRALDDLVGPSNVLEILGKPYDIEQLVASIRSVLDVCAPASGEHVPTTDTPVE